MKQYNFDEVIERRGTSCVKYDTLEKDFGNADLIPLWVADLDFRTPDFIIDAIKKRCEHEIFGYTFAPESYYNSIINWVHYKHQWDIPGRSGSVTFRVSSKESGLCCSASRSRETK